MRATKTPRIVAAVLAVTLAGCASPPPAPAAPDGGHCFKIGRSYRPTRTCTTAAIPPADLEAEAKRFETVAGMATVFVVRRRWADTVHLVPLTIDGRAGADTIPHSVVRLRLSPGLHQLSVRWQGHSETLDIDARAGELRFVEIDGAAWAWNTRYRWSTDDPDGARQRALKSKLIADVRLDPRP